MKSTMCRAPGRIEPRRHIDQHQRRKQRAPRPRRRAMQRASSPARPLSDAPTSTGGWQMCARWRHVARERVHRIVAVRRPVAVAVPAQIGRHRVPALPASARAVPPQAWRVCPPPCISSTARWRASPQASATSVSPSGRACRSGEAVGVRHGIQKSGPGQRGVNTPRDPAPRCVLASGDRSGYTDAACRSKTPWRATSRPACTTRTTSR